MTIVLNGSAREVPDGSTVAGLVEVLGLARLRVAVEVNGRVMRREEWLGARLAEHDRVEVVQFVGGG
ncbi:MAG: sulfur carrier protein ThiS [Candidatus Polarisedimenticolia bacterium]